MTENETTYRWWDIPAAILLTAALSTVAIRLGATRWTDYLGNIQMITLFGVVAGLALGFSRFSPRLVRLLAFIYGIFIVTWQLGITIEAEMIWSERISTLLNRLGIIIYQITSQDPVQDSLLFLVLMSFLFWALSSHAGYTLVRHGNAWVALMPSGLALFIIHSFDPHITTRARYLAVYLFFALALVARVAFLHHQSRWQQNRIVLPPHLGLDFIRFTIIAALIIVTFSWTAPALANVLPVAQRAWQPVRQTWHGFVDNFDSAFASLRATIAISGDYYGSSAVLGLGAPLTDAQVFTVRPPSNMPDGLRLYWRARTYETYEDGQWLSRDNVTEAFDPETSGLPETPKTGRWTGSFEFVSATSMTTIFTPSQPLWVSRTGQIEYFRSPDNTIDITTLRARPMLETGQLYTAQSSLIYATEDQLRQAGEEYPAWMKARYLQVPTSITLRTRRLAETITEDFDNPYDKAVAITEYLRDNITYVEVIDENPPANRDLIDWFLFDLKKGFCNYYSSAEIMMLRSIGIPARWAAGYAQGEKVSIAAPSSARINNTMYVVRQRDAHAWPEVYFPEIGWVEFEPTASQPEIVRLTEITTGPLTPPNNTTINRDQDLLDEELELLRDKGGSTSSTPNGQKQTNVVYWLIPLGLASAAVLFYLVWKMRSQVNLQAAPIWIEKAFYKVHIRPPQFIQHWARRASLSPLARAYLEINHALSRLGQSPAANATPGERAAQLSQLAPPTKEPADTLVAEYQIGTFSQQDADLDVAEKSAAEVRRLSFKARFQSLLTRFQEPENKRRRA